MPGSLRKKGGIFLSGGQVSFGQIQQQALRQSMSVQQIQYLKLLQFNALELQQYLAELQLENPLVELEAPVVSAPEADEPTPLDLARWMAAHPAPQPDEDPADRSQPDPRGQGAHTDEGRYDLLAYLRSQFDLSLPDLELSLLERLIASLDENGYLTAAPEEFARLWGIDPVLVREAVGYLQTLDPPGVGAGCLGECLCIQLTRRGLNDPVAFELVQHHLESLALGHFYKAARETGSTPEQVRRLYDIIRTLHPRPASAFGGAAAAYILPDVTIVEQDGALSCVYNRHYNPQIRINQSYLSLSQNDAQAQQYVNRKLSQAMWVVRAIDSRRQTIEQIVDVILERQRAFFLEQDGARSPMRLRDVSEQIGVHESTVSRAIREKYLQCRRGVFALKYFFTGAVACGQDDSPVGSHSVKGRIRSLIECENPQNPLSDSAISRALASDGLTLARRTVAKYREELGIASSALRKRP
jgi:RNA polymerase sigma-54 factor